MKQWKAFFLDVDNTLLDFDEYVRTSIRDGFAFFQLHTACSDPYAVFTEENNKLWRRIEDGSLTFEGLEQIRWNIIFDKLGIDFDGPRFEQYFREALNESAIPVAGALELACLLHECGLVCAASNGPYYQQVHRLELAGMSKCFDYYFISERLGASKPAPEFFERGFSLLNEGRGIPIQPSECLIIGDSLTSDIAGGKAIGMDTCFYNHSCIPESKIHEYKPTFHASTLSAISSWITSQVTP